MPGLVGIIGGKERGRDISKLLPAMCSSMKHRDDYSVDSYVNESIGLGRISLGITNTKPQPIFNEDGSVCVMMDGEVYDYQSIKDELAAKGHKFKVNNDAEFVLHLYEEYGREFAGKINGSFLAAIWDKGKQELILANDRFGTRPLQYAVHEGRLLFGSEAKAILQDSSFRRTVNDEAVVDYFTFGYLLGNKTFFKGIELLPPGSLLSWKDGLLETTRYWDIRYAPEEHAEEYYIDNLSHLLLKAVDRQLGGDGRILVPLSGGLDSRALVAAVEKLGKTGRITGTFTYGKPNSDDVRFARMISKKASLKHHFHELKGMDLPHYSERIVKISECMGNCWGTHILSTAEDMRRQSDVVLSGYLGGVLIGGYGLGNLSSPDSQFDRFKLLGSPPSLNILTSLLSPNFYSQIEGYYEHILDGMDNKALTDKYEQFDYFDILQRQRRLINQVDYLVATQVEMRRPFCDNDLTDLIFKIPLRLRQNNRLYLKLYKKVFPEQAKIPWQKTGAPIDATNSCIRLVRRLRWAKKITNILAKKLGLKPLFEDTREFADYSAWMRQETQREYIEKILLDERTLSRPYFNRECVKEILQQHMNEEKDNFELIGLLLTFELWHRIFIDKK